MSAPKRRLADTCSRAGRRRASLPRGCPRRLRSAPMRTLALVPLAVLVAGCLAPDERDLTRYPWQSPTPRYCIVSLESARTSGVGTRAPMSMTCTGRVIERAGINASSFAPLVPEQPLPLRWTGLFGAYERGSDRSHARPHRAGPQGSGAGARSPDDRHAQRDDRGSRSGHQTPRSRARAWIPAQSDAVPELLSSACRRSPSAASSPNRGRRGRTPRPRSGRPSRGFRAAGSRAGSGPFCEVPGASGSRELR